MRLFELFVLGKEKSILAKKITIFFLEGRKTLNESNLIVGGLAERTNGQVNRG